jgi:hypothetical protein
VVRTALAQPGRLILPCLAKGILLFVWALVGLAPFSEAFTPEPSSYSLRVQAMGNADLAIEDETTDINLFNYGNPAGLPYLPHQDRLDLNFGMAFRTEPYTDYDYLLAIPMGNYHGATLWLGENVVSRWNLLRGEVGWQFLQDWTAAAAVGTTAIYRMAAYTQIGTEISLGLSRRFLDVFAPDQPLVVGLQGGVTDYGSVSEIKSDYNLGVQVYVPMTSSLQMGINAQFQSRQEEGSYVSYHGDFSGSKSFWNISPVLRLSLPLGEDSRFQAGARYRLERYSQVQTLDIVEDVGGLPVVREGLVTLTNLSHLLALGLGFQAWGESLQGGLQIDYATQTQRNSYFAGSYTAPRRTNVHFGLEFLPLLNIAIRAGIIWQASESTLLLEPVYSAGIGITMVETVVVDITGFSQRQCDGAYQGLPVYEDAASAILALKAFF